MAIIVLIWVGAIRVDLGIITQGAVVALYNYMSQILTELIKLANLIINITKSLACGNRIQSVLEVESSITDGNADSKKSGETVERSVSDNVKEMREKNPYKKNSAGNTSQYSVVFDHAGICYPQAAREAISGIDLKVKKGQTVGIIGGTGSGKSSMVNLIPRFYEFRCGLCGWKRCPGIRTGGSA